MLLVLIFQMNTKHVCVLPHEELQLFSLFLTKALTTTLFEKIHRQPFIAPVWKLVLSWSQRAAAVHYSTRWLSRWQVSLVLSSHVLSCHSSAALHRAAPPPPRALWMDSNLKHTIRTKQTALASTMKIICLLFMHTAPGWSELLYIILYTCMTTNTVQNRTGQN